jgi:type I site-specific restriction endonuclease
MNRKLKNQWPTKGQMFDCTRVYGRRIKDPNGVLPGKTIFLYDYKHARRMEELFDAFYPEYHVNQPKYW